MIEGIESEDWYGSESARALRAHIESRIDWLIHSMRGYAREGDSTGAAWSEGGINELEQLRNDITPSPEDE